MPGVTAMIELHPLSKTEFPLVVDWVNAHRTAQGEIWHQVVMTIGRDRWLQARSLKENHHLPLLFSVKARKC